jgi:hypothetical protein
VEAYEDDQIVARELMDLSDWFERDVGGVIGLERVNDVGVATCYGAEFVGVGAGEDAGGIEGLVKPRAQVARKVPPVAGRTSSCKAPRASASSSPAICWG